MRNLSRNLIKLLSIVFLYSCINDSDRFTKDRINQLAAQGFIKKEYQKQGFKIFTLQKISNNQKSLRIYIEGDGFAYVNKNRPSIDPTPRNSFLLDLVKEDNAENLVYIARPCQYIRSERCEEKHWTSERFSAELISTISAVIDEFKDYEIELVGYSGGAFVALNLQQKNIKNIRTIAGNLDLDEFVKIHKISPLLFDKLNYEKLSKVPQIHFVGALDKIIPLEIFTQYQQKLPTKSCVKMKIINGATHNKNWQNSWKELLMVIPVCS